MVGADDGLALGWGVTTEMPYAVEVAAANP